MKKVMMVVVAAVTGIVMADADVDALKACRVEAEKGNAKAQFYLGMCYSNGEGVEKDGAEAVKWYRKAAEMGERTAQNNLASCLMSGEGVEKDPVEAGKWFRKSAEQGYGEAQVNLGVYCDRGEGGVKDHAEAVKWFRRAAAQGHPAARKRLAELGVAWELDPFAPLGLKPGMSAESVQAQLEKLDEKGDYQLAQCEADKVSRKVYSVVVATREGLGYAEAFARSDVLAKLFMARHKSKPEFVVNKATWREMVDGHAYKYELGVKEADDVKGKWFVVYGIFDLTLGKEVQARLLRGDAEKLAITFRKSDGTKVTVPVKQALEAKDKPYPVK